MNAEMITLKIGRAWNPRWQEMYEHGAKSFAERFWNEQGGYFYDMVDVNQVPETVDASLRPNQILAVGGLPFGVLEGEKAHKVMDAVEAKLPMPLRLRSLSPDDSAYPPPLRRQRLPARHYLPQGHGLALADGAVCGSLVAGTRQLLAG